MSNIVFHNSYKLKKGVSVSEFLVAVESVNNEYISKQAGYISFKLLVDGEIWADSTAFETMEDAKSFAEACEPNEFADEFAEKFYSLFEKIVVRATFFHRKRVMNELDKN